MPDLRGELTIDEWNEKPLAWRRVRMLLQEPGTELIWAVDEEAHDMVCWYRALLGTRGIGADRYNTREAALEVAHAFWLSLHDEVVRDLEQLSEIKELLVRAGQTEDHEEWETVVWKAIRRVRRAQQIELP